MEFFLKRRLSVLFPVTFCSRSQRIRRQHGNDCDGSSNKEKDQGDAHAMPWATNEIEQIFKNMSVFTTLLWIRADTHDFFWSRHSFSSSVLWKKKKLSSFCISQGQQAALNCRKVALLGVREPRSQQSLPRMLPGSELSSWIVRGTPANTSEWQSNTSASFPLG